jgi:rhamnogalacturonan endolyase
VAFHINNPKINSIRIIIAFVILIIIPDVSVHAQRQMENLDRGLVAVKDGNNVYVGWRMLGTESDNTEFNVYWNDIKINAEPITNSTNFIDSYYDPNALYTVRSVVDGNESSPSRQARIWSQNYIKMPLETPPGYTPNDGSVGDLDGDGEYELVLHQTGRSRDNSQSGITDEPILQAYELDGTLMWSINLGRNIREGAHYTQFIVYDLDGDGKAEVACKTADGTVDGLGKVIGNPNANYVNSSGYILSGPEYLTIFDGQTGAELVTTNYIPPRGSVSSWGDNYGNRVDRFLACVAYLDGVRPSLIMCRGYYTRTVLVAWNWRDGELTNVWTFDSYDGTPGNYAYSGQGNHSIAVADVDNDGKDEIIYGACCIDDNGKGLWCSGLGHGDAMHVSDLDPQRPGLEVYGIHEGNNTPGAALLDARTGEIIWQTSNADSGRGVAADIDPRYPGAECWGGPGGTRNIKGVPINVYPSSTNFVCWWDGDLTRELLDSNRIDKVGTGTLLVANGCVSNNGTKSTPVLSADILGDWREEVIFRESNNQNLRIYTTTIPTEHRFYTLMHDPVYRLSIAWQNVAYNQPPHVGFYLGEGMEPAPRPDIKLVGNEKTNQIRVVEVSKKKFSQMYPAMWFSPGTGEVVSFETRSQEAPYPRFECWVEPLKSRFEFSNKENGLFVYAGEGPDAFTNPVYDVNAENNSNLLSLVESSQVKSLPVFYIKSYSSNTRCFIQIMTWDKDNEIIRFRWRLATDEEISIFD